MASRVTKAASCTDLAVRNPTPSQRQRRKGKPVILPADLRLLIEETVAPDNRKTVNSVRDSGEENGRGPGTDNGAIKAREVVR